MLALEAIESSVLKLTNGGQEGSLRELQYLRTFASGCPHDGGGSALAPESKAAGGGGDGGETQGGGNGGGSCVGCRVGNGGDLLTAEEDGAGYCVQQVAVARDDASARSGAGRG